MPILHIAFPRLKPLAPEALEELLRTAVPIAVRAFKSYGALSGLRGWFSAEDGRDVSHEWRECVIIEWSSLSNFQTLAESSDWKEFGAIVGPHVASFPPELKLFEADKGGYGGLIGGGIKGVVEILDIRADEEVLEKAVGAVLEAYPGSSSLVRGTSVNTEQKQMVIMSGFADREAYDSANKEPARQEFLSSLRSKAASVTQLVADVDKLSFDE